MTEPITEAKQKFSSYPLMQAMRERRSRRFGMGMRIEKEPLAHTSMHEPLALSETEEAILAFAACGITGPALSDWTFAPGAGGNMMAGFIGRTIPSADAISRIALVVINDEATYLMKRPCDLAPNQIAELVQLAAQEEYLEIWRKVRVKLADSRCAPPTAPPYNLNANRWSLHAKGTTYFLPIADLTFLYINALLELFNEDTGFFPMDERAMFLPAGVARFARSKGGHMEDDPRQLKGLPIEAVEKNVTELLSVEIGAALQNLGLACEALGLGGFPHYSQHDIAWFQALGFRMGEQPLTRFLHVPAFAAWVLRLRGQDIKINYPLGLERDGQVLLKAYCPPYSPSMEAAVRAVVDEKFGHNGIWRSGLAGSAWRDPAKFSRDIPPISEKAIAATIAYCEYIWKRYGRFPAYPPPFHTVMGFQAHHVDVDFYDRHYQPQALSERHRQHLERWH